MGPCTSIAVSGLRTYFCFQNGLQVAEDSRSWWLETPFRPFAIAAHGQAGNVLLGVGGGEPARSGWVCVLDATGRPLARRQVGRDVVYAVALSPDGRHLAAGCANGQVLLLDLPGLTSVRTLQGHTAPCRSVVFSPDGARLASGGRDGLVIVRSLGDGKVAILQDHTAGVECVAFGADSRLMASGALDGKVRIHQGNLLRRTYQKLGGQVSSLAFAPGGRLYAGLLDGRVLRLGGTRASTRLVGRVDQRLSAMAYRRTELQEDALAVGSNGTWGWIVAGLQSPTHEAPSAARKPASRPALHEPAASQPAGSGPAASQPASRPDRR